MDEESIPDYVYINRVRVLLEDENSFIGVGYWDSYNWVLDVPGDNCNHEFGRIERYAFLD